MTDIFHFDTPETPTRLYTEFMQKETENAAHFEIHSNSMKKQEQLKSSAMH